MYSDKDPQVAAHDYNMVPVKKFWKNPPKHELKPKGSDIQEVETKELVKREVTKAMEKNKKRDTQLPMDKNM